MVRNLVFLFIFVFSPLAFIVSGENVGSPEIDKPEPVMMTPPAPKTMRDSIEEKLSDWQVAECSFYDPLDSSQTKANPDGVGTSMRKIESGSIGLGSSFTKDFIKDSSCVVFIQVKDCDIVTPYGKGIFRVDDTMRGRYNKGDKFYIDFFYGDLTYSLRRAGRFDVEFRVHKIVKIEEMDQMS